MNKRSLLSDTLLVAVQQFDTLSTCRLQSAAWWHALGLLDCMHQYVVVVVALQRTCLMAYGSNIFVRGHLLHLLHSQPLSLAQKHGWHNSHDTRPIDRGPQCYGGEDLDVTFSCKHLKTAESSFSKQPLLASLLLGLEVAIFSTGRMISRRL